jgi:hypothetical protein
LAIFIRSVLDVGRRSIRCRAADADCVVKRGKSSETSGGRDGTVGRSRQDYLPLIERLAAEAIAISLGADPKTVQVRDGIRVYDAVIFGEVDFNPE